MRVVDKPTLTIKEVFDACVSSIRNARTRSKFENISDIIETSSNNYDTCAQAARLFQILPNNSDNSQEVISGVTKLELINLYDQQMVQNNAGRQFYDRLIVSAPYGKCLFCGFGPVRSLDHFLPKTKFPLLTVAPINLVPCCSDCNKDKGDAIYLCSEEQNIHPYFDTNLLDIQWIYADIEITQPLSFKYYVTDTIESWDDVMKQRVGSHFSHFNLAERFAIEASDELSSIQYELSQFENPENLRLHLRDKADTNYRNHKNHWKTGMYQALANNDWFCEEGYSTAEYF